MVLTVCTQRQLWILDRYTGYTSQSFQIATKKCIVFVMHLPGRFIQNFDNRCSTRITKNNISYITYTFDRHGQPFTRVIELTDHNILIVVYQCIVSYQHIFCRIISPFAWMVIKLPFIQRNSGLSSSSGPLDIVLAYNMVFTDHQDSSRIIVLHSREDKIPFDEVTIALADTDTSRSLDKGISPDDIPPGFDIDNFPDSQHILENIGLYRCNRRRQGLYPISNTDGCGSTQPDARHIFEMIMCYPVIIGIGSCTPDDYQYTFAGLSFKKTMINLVVATK